MKQKFQAALIALVAALSFLPGVAAAAPIAPVADWSATFGSIQTEVASMIGAAWPVLIAITGGFILMKLGKRAMRSAT